MSIYDLSKPRGQQPNFINEAVPHIKDSGSSDVERSNFGWR